MKPKPLLDFLLVIDSFTESTECFLLPNIIQRMVEVKSYSFHWPKVCTACFTR